MVVLIGTESTQSSQRLNVHSNQPTHPAQVSKMAPRWRGTCSPLKRSLQPLSQIPISQTNSHYATQNKIKRSQFPINNSNKRKEEIKQRNKTIKRVSWSQVGEFIQYQNKQKHHQSSHIPTNTRTRERDVLFVVRWRRRRRRRLQERRIPRCQTGRSVRRRTIHCTEKAWMGTLLHRLARIRYQIICMFRNHDSSSSYGLLHWWVFENPTFTCWKMASFLHLW